MPDKIDIPKLVSEAKRGQWSAQKALYLFYADDMMSIAIRYSRDISAAKDLVQDTFIKFFEKIDQFDINKGMPGPWISRILINRALTNIKKDKKCSYEEESYFFLEPSKEMSIVDKLQAEDMLKLLEQVPEGARVIFNLHVIEGYKHEEIGAMLGITAGTSRSQLARAKRIMRNIIKKNDYTYISYIG